MAGASEFGGVEECVIEHGNVSWGQPRLLCVASPDDDAPGSSSTAYLLDGTFDMDELDRLIAGSELPSPCVGSDYGQCHFPMAEKASIETAFLPSSTTFYDLQMASLPEAPTLPAVQTAEVRALHAKQHDALERFRCTLAEAQMVLDASKSLTAAHSNKLEELRQEINDNNDALLKAFTCDSPGACPSSPENLSPSLGYDPSDDPSQPDADLCSRSPQGAKESPRRRFVYAPALLRGHPYNPVTFDISVDPETRRPFDPPGFRTYTGHSVHREPGMLNVWIDTRSRYGVIVSNCYKIELASSWLGAVRWKIVNDAEDPDSPDRHRIPPTPDSEYVVTVPERFADTPVDKVPVHLVERIFNTVHLPSTSASPSGRSSVSCSADPASGLPPRIRLVVSCCVDGDGVIDCARFCSLLCGAGFGDDCFTVTGVEIGKVEEPTCLLRGSSRSDIVCMTSSARTLDIRSLLEANGYIVENDVFKRQAIGIFFQEPRFLQSLAQSVVESQLLAGIKESDIMLSVQFPLRTYVIRYLCDRGSKEYTREYLKKYRKTLYDRGPRLSPRQTVQLQDAYYWTFLAPDGRRIDYSEIIRYYSDRGLTVRLKHPHDKNGRSVGRTSASGHLREFSSASRRRLGAAASKHVVMAPDGEIVAKNPVKSRRNDSAPPSPKSRSSSPSPVLLVGSPSAARSRTKRQGGSVVSAAAAPLAVKTEPPVRALRKSSPACPAPTRKRASPDSSPLVGSDDDDDKCGNGLLRYMRRRCATARAAGAHEQGTVVKHEPPETPGLLQVAAEEACGPTASPDMSLPKPAELPLPSVPLPTTVTWSALKKHLDDSKAALALPPGLPTDVAAAKCQEVPRRRRRQRTKKSEGSDAPGSTVHPEGEATLPEGCLSGCAELDELLMRLSTGDWGECFSGLREDDQSVPFMASMMDVAAWSQ